MCGAPGRIRTHDPLVRSQVLYPTELRARAGRESSTGPIADRTPEDLSKPVFSLQFGATHVGLEGGSARFPGKLARATGRPDDWATTPSDQSVRMKVILSITL